MEVSSVKDKIAFIVSRIFGPESVMPMVTWFLFTFFSGFEWEDNWQFVVFSFVFFIAVPITLFIVSYFGGFLTDLDATIRQERPPLLFIKQLSFSVGLVVVWQTDAVLMKQLYVWWYVTIFAVLLISTAWKVSIHMMAATTLLVALVQLFGTSWLALSPILILVAWSRYALKKHEISQLIVGSVVPIASWWLVKLTLT